MNQAKFSVLAAAQSTCAASHEADNRVELRDATFKVMNIARKDEQVLQKLRDLVQPTDDNPKLKAAREAERRRWPVLWMVLDELCEL